MVNAEIPSLFSKLTEGAPIFTEGPELSTMNAVEGPAAGARLLAASDAVPAAMLMATVPSPKQKDKVTERVVFPDPLTLIEQFAVPVVTKLMFALANVTVVAPE